MKTAATRLRSSAMPVSFSTIEARMTISSGEASGRPGARRFQMSWTTRSWSRAMRLSTLWRVSPRLN